MLNLRPLSPEKEKEVLSQGMPDTGEFFAANVAEGFDNSTTGVAIDAVKESLNSDWDVKSQEAISSHHGIPLHNKKITAKTLKAEEWKKSPHFREGIEFKDDWSESRAKYLAEQYDNRKLREQTLSRGDNAMIGSGLAGQLVGGLPDPINLLPISQGFKAASLGAKIGAAAVEGAVGNLAVSAISRPYYEDRGVDSDWGDYVNDLFIGGVMGGGFGAAGHGISKAMEVRKNATLKDRKVLGDAQAHAAEAVATGDELDLNSKVPAINEAIKKMRELPEVMKDEAIQERRIQLEELGYSKEEADANLAIMAQQAEFFSQYGNKSFDEALADIQGAEIKDGKIIPTGPEGIAHVKKINEFLDSELKTMEQEILFAEKGGQKLFVDGQYVSTTGEGSFPSWYAEAGVKNKEHLAKVMEAKKGPIYERLKEIAEKRLMDGYESPTAGRVEPAVEYAQLKNTSDALYKKSGKGKEKTMRGAYQPDKNVISIFKDADRSTFIHETGHLILKNLQDLADADNAMAKADLATIQKWVDSLPKDKGVNAATNLHEKFARGFERYLMEGRAPNKELAGVFERFKNWLSGIYKRVEKLNAPINDDIRAIFDKILGGEQKADLEPTRTPEAPLPRHATEADLDKAVNSIDLAINEAELKGASSEDIKVLREVLEEIGAEEKAIDEAFTLFQSGKSDDSAAIKAAANAADVSKSTMQEIIDAFNEQLLREAGEKVDAVKAAEVAEQMKIALAAEAKEVKRQAYLSLQARAEVAAHVKTVLDAGGTPKQALLSLIEGDSTLRGVEGAGKSVDGHYMALAQSTSSRCYGELRKLAPDIEKLFEDDIQFNQNVLKEMIKPGSSNGDDLAASAAQILKKYGHEVVDRANLAGAKIGKLEGWVPRTHDTDKMIGKRSEWKRFMLENLDSERTFVGMDEAAKDDALEEIFASLITDNHGSKMGIDADAPMIRPPRNIAKKMGEHRSLHFKSPEAELAYLREFGQGDNILQAMSRHIESMSRSTALMERLGPNPESTIAYTLQKMHDDIRLQLKEKKITDIEANKIMDEMGDVGRMKARDSEIGHALGMALGENDSTQGMFKGFSRFMRAINMFKLGASLLSQPSDFVHAVNERRIVTENNVASAWVELFSDYFSRAHKNPEIREVLEHTGIFVDAMNLQNYNRFEADNINNRIQRWNDKMFRYSGQEWHVKSSKKAAALSLTRELGANMDKSWADMHPGLRETLVQYGSFNEQKWELLRKTAPEMIDGKAYYHPGLINKIADDAFEDMLPSEFQVANRPQLNETLPLEGAEVPREIKAWEDSRAKEIVRARQKLEMDLKTFFVEEGRNAAPEPDAKVRRKMSFGAKQGTKTHEAIKLLTQFKTFAFVNWDRSIKGKRMMRDANDYGGLAHHAAAMLTMGYVSIVLKDLSKGQTPSDPTKASTWGRAAMQCGGLGIAGDFFGSAYSARSGSDVLSTIAGPTVSTLANVSVLALKGLHGETYEDGSKYAAKWVDMGKSFTPAPFSTLWYTRATMDYLVWRRLKEELEPGSTRRSERRLKKQFGQKYLIK